jgi:hypothetical protein
MPPVLIGRPQERVQNDLFPLGEYPPFWGVNEFKIGPFKLI